ncbi:hypothetical protein GW17_00051712 [Ensete ventricosum]|nr:hypothetical protein GW17_00051712 [Ensete ventricosum]
MMTTSSCLLCMIREFKEGGDDNGKAACHLFLRGGKSLDSATWAPATVSLSSMHEPVSHSPRVAHTSRPTPPHNSAKLHHVEYTNQQLGEAEERRGNGHLPVSNFQPMDDSFYVSLYSDCYNATSASAASKGLRDVSLQPNEVDAS